MAAPAACDAAGRFSSVSLLGVRVSTVLPRVLRPPQIAAHLGVSVRWVHRLMQEPEDRPGPKWCGGLPKLPSVEHPAGGRGVRSDVYVEYLQRNWPEALPEAMR